MIVGTFQYMSPEQIEGREVDGRSDIFSLGSVLYEMLTGKKAFDGKSQLSVASAILEKEPESVSIAKPMTPPALGRVVAKCLAKLPDERWQSASDLATQLKWMADGNFSTLTPRAEGKKRWGWLVSAAFLLLFMWQTPPWLVVILSAAAGALVAAI